MKEFEPLIGEWHGEGEMPIEPPMKLSVEAKVERLGGFMVFQSTGEPADVPDSISIIGGAPDGEPQPMHSFDARGVERLYRDPRRLHLDDLAGPRLRLARPPRARLQPALHRRDLGRWQRRSRAAGSGAWETPATSGSSTSRSTTSASSAAPARGPVRGPRAGRAIAPPGRSAWWARRAGYHGPMDGPRRRTRTGDPATEQSAAAARSAEPLAAVDPAAFPDRETRRAIDGGAASARFRELLDAGGSVMADGAMGTMLFQNGLQFGDPPEVWNLTQPEIIRRIQRGYLDGRVADHHDQHVRWEPPAARPARPVGAGG